MLHLVKLAVGISDVAHLRRVQAAREVEFPPLRHRTRNMPRRAAELVDGGSLYWVIAGAVVARQRILEVIADRWDDGVACAGLVLDRELVPVTARVMKPFQGWRYLPAQDAPPDVGPGGAAIGEAVLPASLLKELRELRLL